MVTLFRCVWCLSLISTSGCASFGLSWEQTDFKKLKLGDSKTKVVQIMSKPERIFKMMDDEVWIWEQSVAILNKDILVHKTDREATRFEMKIDAFNGDFPISRRAIVLPFVKGMNRSDLEFKLPKQLTEAMLKTKGYQVTDDASKADVGVFVYFKISDPKTVSETVSIPIYDYVSPPTQQATETTQTLYNNTGQSLGTIESRTTPVNSFSVPQRVYRGSESRTYHTTTYLRRLELEAIDMKLLTKKRETKQFWKIAVNSEGSSEDIRRALPPMAYAARYYIERDSGGIKTARYFEDDPRIRQFLLSEPKCENCDLDNPAYAK